MLNYGIESGFLIVAYVNTTFYFGFILCTVDFTKT